MEVVAVRLMELEPEKEHWRRAPLDWYAQSCCRAYSAWQMKACPRHPEVGISSPVYLTQALSNRRSPEESTRKSNERAMERFQSPEVLYMGSYAVSYREPFHIRFTSYEYKYIFCLLQCTLIRCYERPVSHVESVGARVSIHTSRVNGLWVLYRALIQRCHIPTCYRHSEIGYCRS
jgi:hypothetical protein